MIAIDTNVWVYGHDTGDAEKQTAALRFVDSASNICLPWQVGCEFLSASKELIRIGFTEECAWTALESMIRMSLPPKGFMRSKSSIRSQW